MGNERTRLPVAAKMALHRAGITGGRAGSPSPVGPWSVRTKCTSIGGAAFIRTGGKPSKLACSTRPSLMVIAAEPWVIASITAPWTWLRALVGLMIWRPTSAATHTLSIFQAPALDTLAWMTWAK